MKVRPRAVDLFAGCGGLSLGLKKAGFEVVLAVELNAAAAASYKLNHPSVKLLQRDIRDINLTDQLRAIGIEHGKLDLLAACPPCQGFSTMRTLNECYRIDDDRNDLISYVAAILEDLRPTTFLFENVPNIRHDWRFKKLVTVLEQLGYFFDYTVLDAYDFGVPQRRRRLVLAASLIASPQPFVRTRRHRTVAQSIAHLPTPGSTGDPLHDHVKPRTPRIQRLIELIPKNGGSRAALPSAKQLDCHKRTTGFKDVYGRLAWEKPANTITSGCVNPSKGRFLHPVQNRPISLREAALLQSFPRKYKFAGRSVSAIALQIGNAIPPPLARAHAAALADTLELASNR